MSFVSTYAKAHDQFVMHVSASASTPYELVSKTLDALEASAAAMRSAITEQHSFYSYDIRAKLGSGRLSLGSYIKGKLAEANGFKAEDEFEPWSDGNIAFWKLAAEQTALHPRILDWLSTLFDLARDLQDHAFEHDQTAFGEVATSILALANPVFVPAYVQFMQIWDLEAEVMQEETIGRIVANHGFIPAVEDLLVLRATTCAGQVGVGQLEAMADDLEAHYGDFSKSEVFARIVQAWLRECRKRGYQPDSLFEYSDAPAWKAEAIRQIAAAEGVTT